MRHYHRSRKARASTGGAAWVLAHRAAGFCQTHCSLTREVLIDPSNPAVLSTALGQLFPPGAVVCELRSLGDTRLLLPDEAAHLKRAVAKRAQEFAAGRLCARQALAAFGIVDFAIKVASDRRPLWPSSVVGSITHTNGFCAAVVAERRHLAAIGMDSEEAQRVKPELWDSICVPEEIAWLTSLPESERAAGAAFVFSAKEAFYKCQYPLTEQFLGFHAARVQAREWGGARGSFTVSATRDIKFAAHARLPIRGEYLFHEQFVTAAVSLAAHSAA